VQRRETFTPEEAGELEAIMQSEVWGDLLGRTDGASTQEHRLEDRPRSKRQIRPGGMNGPRDRVESHCHHDKSTGKFWIKPAPATRATLPRLLKRSYLRTARQLIFLPGRADGESPRANPR
jgi:hypothetical protein